MHRLGFALLACSAALTACTHAAGLYTEGPITSASSVARGVPYSLARGVVAVNALQASCTDAANKSISLQQYSISFDDPVIAADATAQLRYAPQDRSDDTLTIETSDGLLTKAYFSGQDRSADAAAKVVDLYKAVVLASHGIAAPAALLKIPADKVTCASPISWTKIATFPWDPQNVDSTTNVTDGMTTAIKAAGGSMVASLEASRPLPSAIATPIASGACPAQSLCFRPLGGFDLFARLDGHVVTADSVMLPVKAELSGVEVKRAPFVKADTEIDFAKGVPTKFHVSKPNSATVVVDALIGSVRTVGSIPAALIEGMTTEQGKQQALIDAQTKNLDSQTKLLEARAKLVKAQNDLATATKGADKEAADTPAAN